MSTTLPKIYQPWIDILPQDPLNPSRGNNPLIAVYWYTYRSASGTVIEYNLVFKDEDHPIAAVDSVYDAIRLWKYGRVEDIEHFFVIISSNNVRFPDTYSGSQTFFVIKPDHKSTVESYSENKIYINTWNHLMSASRDTNPHLPKKIWTSYPLRHGDRHKAECDFSSKC